ncbi:MAG: DUF424 domain-containing protein [Haloarculaceae archaeon]
MLLNEWTTQRGRLVAVCDADVLGETFENGDLSLTVEEGFYGGDATDPEEVVERLGRADVANLVGTEVVALAIEHGFVEESNVLDIDGTRHAQFLRL